MTTPSEIRTSPSGPLFDVAGAQGAFGGAFTFPYAFALGTPPPDPGLGQVKLNLGPQNTATEILISTVDSNSALIDSALATIDDSTNPIKGFVRLVGETDTTKWLLFTVTAISAEVAGVRTVSVTCVASSSANPFSDLDPILFCFDTSGDKGDTGPTEGWAASLAIDEHSGPTSPIIDPGESLLFTDQGLITAGSDVIITATGGDAELHGSTGALVEAVAGDAELGAPAGDALVSAQGDATIIAATGTARLEASGGNAEVSAQGDATVTAATGTALVEALAGDAALEAPTGDASITGETTTIAATVGTASMTGQGGASITATTGALALAASAAAATLTAATSVAITAATTAALTASTGLTLETATGGATLRATSSNVTLQAQGAGSDVSITAADAVAITATAGALGLSAGTTASLTGGTGASVTATTGTLTLSALAGAIAFIAALGFSFTATTGDITLTAAAGSITLDGAVNATLRAGSGTALVQSTAAAASVSGATTASLTGGTGASVTATTGSLALAASAAAATLTAATTLGVTATSGLTLQTATGNAVLRATSSSVTVEAQGAGNDVTITAADALTLTATAGAWSATSGTTAALSSGTVLTLTGGTSASLTATTSTLSLTASAGNLNLTAGGTSLYQTSGNMTLRTTNGALAILAQGAGNAASLTAANGAATLQAQGAGNNANVIGANALVLTATAGGIVATAGTTVALTGASGASLTATTGTLALAASAAAATLSAGTTITLTGGTGIAATATTGNVDITSTAAAINLSASTLVTINNFLRFTSQAASTPVLGAGQGMFWVLTATPTTPQFTDSANTDWELATLPIQPSDLATQAEGTTLLRALGTGTGTPIAGSGAQLAQNIRFGTDVEDTTVGTQNAFIVSPLTDNIRFTPASALTINGIAYAGPTTPTPAGKEILLYCSRTSAQNITIAHDSASATDPTFRIFCPNNANVVLRPGDSCYIRYAFSRWILSPLPQSVVANDTFPANVSGATAQMSQKTFTSLVSATSSLSWDATNKRIDYIGSTSNVSNASSGAIGVIDISTLLCGGSVTLNPGANANIDGFTAKAEGFWFDLYYNNTSAFVVTLNDDVGSTTTSIRTPQALGYTFTSLETVRLRYLGSRWRVIDRVVPNTGLSTMAANTAKVNATAATAQPTDLAIAAGGALGRAQTGNIISLTGTNQGENLRWAVVIDTTSTGTITSYSPVGYTSGTSNYIRLTPAGTVIIRGMPIAAGGEVTIRLGRSAAFTVTLNHEDGSATAGEAFNCPDNVNYLMRAGEAVIIRNSESRNNVIAAGRVHALRKNSTGTVFTRAQWNLIEGAGITATIADDSTDNEIDITLDQANNVQEDGPTAAGTYEPTLAATTRIYRINPASDVFVNFTGFAFTGGNTGKTFMIVKQGLDGWCSIQHNSGSTASNGAFTPDEQTFVLAQANDAAILWYQTNAARWNMAGLGSNISPWQQARQRTPLGTTNVFIASAFIQVLTFTAGGGGAADDVTMYNANVSFSFILADIWIDVTTAVGGSTITLRTASGGGGSALSNAMSTAATGTVRASQTALASRVTSDSLFARRSDSGVAGALVILCYRF